MRYQTVSDRKKMHQDITDLFKSCGTEAQIIGLAKLWRIRGQRGFATRCLISSLIRHVSPTACPCVDWDRVKIESINRWYRLPVPWRQVLKNFENGEYPELERTTPMARKNTVKKTEDKNHGT